MVKEKEQRQKIAIRTTLMPAYYKEFHCLAQDCRDTCCKGWRIEFDKNDFLRLRRIDAPEEFKSRLDSTVRRLRGERASSPMYAKFQLEKGTCPLQEENGLCSLQLNCGGDALPKVCRVFPRIERYAPGARELCLTTGCEGVLHLLWDRPDGLEFIEEELPQQDRRVFHIPPEGSMQLWFLAVRSLCVDILQARQMPLSSRMLFLGISLEELMEKGWSDEGVKGWLLRTHENLSQAALIEEIGRTSGDLTKRLVQNGSTALMLVRGGVLEARKWLAVLGFRVQAEDKRAVAQLDVGRYQQARARLEQALGDREYFFENIMVNLVLQCKFPLLASKEELWKGYVNLCNLYSFFRFAAVTGCAEEPTKEQLIHTLVAVSRALLHNQNRQDSLRDEFFEHNNATLAHMAILVCD